MPLVMIKSDPRAREKPCLRCGLSLRKVDATHCPECGLSVWMSLNPNDTLEWSNPPWLRRMRTALWVMTAAQVPAIAGYLLVVAAFVFGTAMPVRWGQRPAPVAPGSPAATRPAATTPSPATGTATRHDDSPVGQEEDYEAEGMVDVWPSFTQPVPWALRAGLACLVAFLLVYHGGLVLLTSHENRYPDVMQTVRFASWGAAGVAALMSLGVLALMFTAASHWLPLLVKVSAIAGGLVTWAYLRRMARRMPNSTLAKICGWLMLLPLLGLLKALPWLGIVVLYQVTWLIDFLPIVYLPGAAVLFVIFARKFGACAASADENWAAETSLTR